MDRVINSVVDRVDVRRINVLTPSGRAVAGRAQADMLPLVLLYDRSGRERYRASGFAVRAGVVQKVLETC